MAKYQVKFKTSASKEYKKLPPQIKQRINVAIENLESKLILGRVYDLYRKSF